ncbi:MAG: chromosome segregation protein SMC [Deltaproteobacteria bacterium]|nr:chromosome segregation protein SMC [Deltaproteobacteria bacterium]
MHLKSIELVGFKSFVDRTIIQFERGITGIVGPNGSGKSNVVDAIRWVMGEQSAKHLRGGEMLDVIFAGSQSRAPMGMASVFITFDNSDGRAPAEFADYAEITVGRRLYRSGESEYFINKTPCRLKDIIDLFLGTGTGTKAYSIVEQGRIGQIVSSKPEERRYLLEEAAGISKFRHRREAAQRKMEATQQNLLRLQDLIQELKRQLGALQRQAKKAERYRELADELRTIDLRVAAHQWTLAQTEQTRTATELQQQCEAEASAAAALNAQETAIAELRLEMAAIETALSAAQQHSYALQNQLHLYETRLALSAKEVEEWEAKRVAACLAQEEAAARVAAWREALHHANDTKLAADLGVASADDELREGETASQAARAELELVHQTVRAQEQIQMNAERELATVTARTEALQRRTAELATQLARAEEETATLAKQQRTTQQTLAEVRGTIAAREQQFLQLGEERGSVAATIAEQQAELARQAAEVESRQAVLQQAQSRLHSLEELQRNLEGYGVGVKALLQPTVEEPVRAGLRGTVADALQVVPEYETAVAAVLGERLQALVVAEIGAAAAAIDYLKHGGHGRSTFIPLAGRTGTLNSDAFSGDGVLGPLTQFVTAAEPFTALVPLLAADVVVVQSLADAVRLWEEHPTTTFVTLDGEVLSPAGIVTGGSDHETGQLLLARRRECETLRVTATTAQTALQTAQELKRRCQERIAGLQQRVTALSQDHHAEEVQLAQYRQQLRHLEQEGERIQRAQTDAQQTTLRIQTERDTAGTEAATLTTTRSDFDTQCRAATGALTEARERETALRQELEQTNERLARIRANLAAQQERARASERDIERLANSIAETITASERKAAEICDGEAAVASAERQRTQLQELRAAAAREAEAALQAQQDVQRRFHDATEQVRDREAGLKELRGRHETAVQAKHAIELTVAQQQERQNFLRYDIMEKYRVEIAEAAPQYLSDDFALEPASARAEELRAKVQQLGGVNSDAITEFEELQSRHDFLVRQATDLENSLTTLQRAIQKINRVSRERFVETFTAINERFERLFPKLFRGGNAKLVLTDESNALEAGVEIIAQPPGKKLQNMTLLSGGEKALTAVAMIFAMFLVRPSPFCLLDEVDAPLDDANIDRFNEMVREMTDYAQFILITHNKRTMELADTLYGVTMEEAGISKIVSVKLGAHARDRTDRDTKTAAA